MDGNPAVAESASEDAVVTDGDKKRKARSATAEVSRMHLMASPRLRFGERWIRCTGGTRRSAIDRAIVGTERRR